MSTHCDRELIPSQPAVGRLQPKALLFFLAGLGGLMLLFRAHFVLFLAKGESMEPGLRSGDLVLVDRQAYRTTEPRRGDIVVARKGNELIVKRVVGLPGEEVELLQGKLQINRRPLAETYAVEPGWLNVRSGRLLADRYALLGDNRSVSSAVSVHAVVAKDEIVGRVIQSFRCWPDWLPPRFHQSTETAVAANQGTRDRGDGPAGS